MAEYDQKPTLKNTNTGETLTLYFLDFNRGAEDYTVEHHPAGRDGDIEQQMGYGSTKYTGTIQITDSMGSGMGSYKDKILAMARSDHPLEMTLDDGSTVNVTMKEPELDKGAEVAPNKIVVNNIELSEIDQPITSL